MRSRGRDKKDQYGQGSESVESYVTVAKHGIKMVSLFRFMHMKTWFSVLQYACNKYALYEGGNI